MSELVPERQSVFVGIYIVCLVVRGDGFAVDVPIQDVFEYVF